MSGIVGKDTTSTILLSAPLSIARYDSPLGPIYIAMEGPDLVALSFCAGQEDFLRLLSKRFAPSPVIEAQTEGSAFNPLFSLLNNYFNGHAIDFQSLRLKLAGTPFDRDVWSALREIPYGEVRSYSAIARAMGRPRACRAVAGACGRNIIPIVIPCHRVLRSDGSTGGWSGGGGPRVKEGLLAIEGHGSAVPRQEKGNKKKGLI